MRPRKRSDFTETEWEQARRLADVLGGGIELERRPTGETLYVSRTYAENVNLGLLMRVCETLACKPEELFFNPDTRDQGYCETCHSTYPVLELWVAR